jgi:hypothetical protein
MALSRFQNDHVALLMASTLGASCCRYINSSPKQTIGEIFYVGHAVALWTTVPSASLLLHPASYLTGDPVPSDNLTCDDEERWELTA